MALQVNDWIWLRLSSRYGVTAAEAQVGDVFKRWLDETAQTWGYSLVDFYASKNVAGTTFGDGAYNYWSGGALQDAAFWIDAFSASGTSVTNLGSGGSALNARYGSTTGVDSADPVLLTHTGTNYLHLPAVANNYVSAPHNAAYRPTSSVSMRFSVSLDAWKPITLSNYLGGHYDGALNQRSYLMAISASSGAPYVNLSVDGTAVAGISASAAPVVNDGDRLAIRADWLAAGPVVRFYTKPVTAAALDDVTSDTGWTQLGTDVTVGVPATLWGATSVMNVAGYPSASGTGSKFYASAVKVDGVLQCATDFTTGITSGSQTTFTESSVNAATVTINRAVSGRKSVAVTRPVWLFGTDDYMEIAADPYGAKVTTTGAAGSYVGQTFITYVTSTATAGAASTLDDTTQAWTVNTYADLTIRITGGTGVGQIRRIASNTATQVTVTSAWTVIPDATSTYTIESNGNIEGDIEIVVRCSMADWTQPARFATKPFSNTGAYAFYKEVGTIRFAFATAAAPATPNTTIIAWNPTFSANTTVWMRATRVSSTGLITLQWAADQATEPSSWTTIGTNTSAIGQPVSNTSGVRFGESTNGTIYRAIVRSGVGGTAVADWAAYGHPALGGSYRGVMGNVWSLTNATVSNANPLNFGSTDSFTVVAIVRQWATPTSFGRYVDKKLGGAAYSGWSLSAVGTTQAGGIFIGDGTTGLSAVTSAPTAGSLTCFTSVVDRTAQTATSFVNNTAGTPTSITTVGSLGAALPVRIGALAAGTTPTGGYQDFELLAVAVVPKALTAAEIARIVAAYQ